MSLPRLIRTLAEEAGLEAEANQLSQGMDVVGDIAILRPKGVGRPKLRRLAKALLAQVPSVKCVYEQEGGVEGEYRLRRLRYLAGEKRTLTLHRENGCAFKVDVRRCYFSPRLSTERLRISGLASRNERVLNMFAGVGPFSITIAKKSGASVTSCELNRYACKLHLENLRLNKVEGLVQVLNRDAAELKQSVQGSFDRVLMPHPSASDRFLPGALLLARKGAVVHYYRHLLGRSEEEAEAGLRSELGSILPRGSSYFIRKVREVGPRWLELAADITI